tara:strand:+ start:349 stop:567 length:219 start_codon:yes stop_codon:yes gene_type:complete
MVDLVVEGQEIVALLLVEQVHPQQALFKDMLVVVVLMEVVQIQLEVEVAHQLSVVMQLNLLEEQEEQVQQIV